uniref:Uncharacterized protein n=1 Tax=Hemiselmis andersenii TaxID=464988 RepID=A0A6T8PPS4_HEMAN|mmetsp:Transcript_24574/g.56953  ORF Transcript_24574/g.56953 Transcript_24574/m.56953 type:complete len:176 (+) Transcript_24574:134-661(+)
MYSFWLKPRSNDLLPQDVTPSAGALFPGTEAIPCIEALIVGEEGFPPLSLDDIRLKGAGMEFGDALGAACGDTGVARPGRCWGEVGAIIGDCSFCMVGMDVGEGLGAAIGDATEGVLEGRGGKSKVGPSKLLDFQPLPLLEFAGEEEAKAGLSNMWMLPGASLNASSILSFVVDD